MSHDLVVSTRLGEYEFGLRSDPPSVGMGGREVLKSIGIGDQEIESLIDQGIVTIELEREPSCEREEPSL